jgi:hypothetical protein
LIALALATAWAFDRQDPLVLHLSGDVTVSGFYVRATSDAEIQVLVDGRVVSVDVALVEGAEVGGRWLDEPAFREQVSAAWEDTRAVALQVEEPTPLPGVALGASLLWAGAGHGILGEGAAFRGYGALQVVFLGAEAFALFYEENPGLAISIGAVDLTFRAISAADARRIAKRRRAVSDIESRSGGT